MNEQEVLNRELVGDLVVSMLAVNNWSLERSFQIRDKLEAEKLFDLEFIRSADHGVLFRALKQAGYVKSDFVVGLLVERLQDMANRLSEDQMQTVHHLLKEKRVKELRDSLLRIKGVGPSVLSNFLVLRGAT